MHTTTMSTITLKLSTKIKDRERIQPIYNTMVMEGCAMCGGLD